MIGKGKPFEIYVLSVKSKQDISDFPIHFNQEIIGDNKRLEEILRTESYCPGVFSGGHRRSENFLGSAGIILDIDNPELSLKKATDIIKKNSLIATIITSRNHQKVKSGVKCDRYHIILPTGSPIKSAEEYKLTCQRASIEFFRSLDDKKCHDSARFFFPSGPDSEVFYFSGENIIDNITENTAAIEKTKKIKNTSKYILSPIDEKYIETYQKHLIEKKLPHIISKYNPTNKTLNLHRDSEDKNPGNFMFWDDNKIYDNKGEKIDNTDYSLKQIYHAEKNKEKPLEALRDELQKELLSSLDTTKEYNIILTSEGQGKSRLVPKFKEIFDVKRVVVLCKSYDQLRNKMKMFKHFYPDIEIEIIPGTEKLLTKYGVTEQHHVYLIDMESGEKYLSFTKSIERAPIEGYKKAEAFDEKAYLDNIVDGKIHKDILLMAEDKLKVEVLIKKRFRREPLVIFDEFNPSIWFKKQVVSDKDAIKIAKTIKKIEEVETWPGCVTPMYEIPNKKYWLRYLKGKKIVLSTEDKVPMFFNNHLSKNIIDVRKAFYTTPNITFRSIKPGLLNSKNKMKVNMAFLSNNYITIGNGINSKINNVSVLGQNYHGDFDNKKIVVFVTQPCPEELAQMTANLNITHEEATLLKMTDNLNQILGRCQGFRNNLHVQSMDIFIPDNFINKILPKLRYIGEVKRTHHNQSNLVDKILHTLYNLVLGVQKKSNLYLNSLQARIQNVILQIKETGNRISSTISAFNWFKWTKQSKALNTKAKILQGVLYSDLITQVFENLDLLSIDNYMESVMQKCQI